MTARGKTGHILSSRSRWVSPWGTSPLLHTRVMTLPLLRGKVLGPRSGTGCSRHNDTLLVLSRYFTVDESHSPLLCHWVSPQHGRQLRVSGKDKETGAVCGTVTCSRVPGCSVCRASGAGLPPCHLPPVCVTSANHHAPTPGVRAGTGEADHAASQGPTGPWCVGHSHGKPKAPQKSAR